MLGKDTLKAEQVVLNTQKIKWFKKILNYKLFFLNYQEPWHRQMSCQRTIRVSKGHPNLHRFENNARTVLFFVEAGVTLVNVEEG